MTEVTPAEQVLRERLADGPVGFDVFMAIALYDPDVGFYATTGRAGGRRGDFITSPETGPLFGVLVGRYLDHVWHDLGEPGDFTLVDAGAGPATLARSVRAADPECLDSLRIVCVEVSAAQRALHPDGVESRADLPDEPITGVIFANELLDNLPFRIADFEQGEWLEDTVMVFDDRLCLTDRPLDDPTAQRLRTVFEAAEGSVVPVADRAREWVEAARSRIRRGRLVAIDYGGNTGELDILDSWLRTYRGHERGSDPFDAIGEQDITADVPFDQLPRPDQQTTQAEWLAGLGVHGLVEEGHRTWNDRAGIGDLEALKARSRINEAEALCDPAGLGGFTVLEWSVG